MLPSIFPSITCFRRQFLGKIWPIQLPFRLLFYIVSSFPAWLYVKVKCILVHALRLCTGRTAYSGSRGIALLFLDLGTRRGEGSATRLGRTLPPGKTRCSLYRRMGGPQGRYGQVRKISPKPGFDPRTVLPVASRYTDWATGSTLSLRNTSLFIQSSAKLIFSILIQHFNWSVSRHFWFTFLRPEFVGL